MEADIILAIKFGLSPIGLSVITVILIALGEWVTPKEPKRQPLRLLR